MSYVSLLSNNEDQSKKEKKGRASLFEHELSSVVCFRDNRLDAVEGRLFEEFSIFSLLKLLLYFPSSVLSRLTFAVSFVERNRVVSSIYRTGHLIIIFFFCASNCLQSNQYQVKIRGEKRALPICLPLLMTLRVVGTSVVFFTTTYALGCLPGSIFFVFVRQGMKVYTSG